MSRSNLNLDRRRFAKALGMGAASLPFFKMLEASAAGTPRPMRLLALCSGYGGRFDFLRPPSVPITARDTPLTDTMLTFDGSVLAPLKAFVPQMLVIEGLARLAGLGVFDPKNPVPPPRSVHLGHDNWAPTAFTCSPVSVLAGTMFHMIPQSGSIEFVLGQKLGGGTAIRSLQVGMGSHDPVALSFDGSGNQLPSLNDPQTFYRQMFGNVSGTPPVPTANTAEIKRKQSLSVIDALNSSAKRFKARLATVERTKLDDHLAALADLEARFSTMATNPTYPPVVCNATVAPPAKTTADSALPDVTAAQFDIITQAFACDRTRFIVADWGVTVNAAPTIVPAVTDLHNQVAHSVEGDNAQLVATANRQMADYQRGCADQLARLMTRMSQTPDGDGTLLDNTLILWTTDFGENVHGGLNVPHILLGGAQKKFRMGRYLNAAPGKHPYNDVKAYMSNNHLFVSILQAFGLDVNQFGSSEFTGPMAGLT